MLFRSGLWELNGTHITAEMGLPNPGAGVQSMNGNQFVDPPGRTSASNSTTNTNTANAAPDPTMRTSMPDVANTASVLNTSAPTNGTSAVNMATSGPLMFRTGAGSLTATDPNSTQHLLFTGG